MRRIVDMLRHQPLGDVVEAHGWLRTRRDSGSLTFLELNDGSCLTNLQILAEEGLANYATEVRKLSTGCSLRVRGTLVASPAKGQAVELRAETIEVLGWADPEFYPLQKKRHSFEFLRSIAHLRPRTNALGAVARVRSALSFAIHRFFHEQGFIQVQTPIITTSDCEGAGEMFTVTTLAPGRMQGNDPFAGDFFGQRAGLTVSGQLQAEIFALSHGRVYTFGPTFRAENSNTSRHLAEFWMLEPEMAFCDLRGDMEMAEAMIKSLVAAALAECAEDLALFEQHVAKGLIDRLTAVRDRPFVHLTYTEAVAELQRAGRDFAFPVQWGVDLQAEHERYLCEEVAQAPVIVTNYPQTIKPFYMRLDDDGRTVAAMDILVAGIGELVGGSQREERFAVLAERMAAAGLDMEQYGWYLDLRRFGSVPHAGFGLGFDRLVQFVTGMQNIRDVVPFPRTPGSAPC
ncbi:MAG: asparagine--tRNA ligase [Desulfobulbus sp.]|nr:asparagine--tRNA ligase [Desulfobulbus sp.]